MDALTQVARTAAARAEPPQSAARKSRVRALGAWLFVALVLLGPLLPLPEFWITQAICMRLSRWGWCC